MTTRGSRSGSSSEGPAEPMPPPSSGVFDLGLQRERTELAWRRTLRSAVVAGLISVRLVAPSSVPAVAASGSMAVALAVIWFVGGHRRQRLVHAALRNTGDLRNAPGAAVLLAASGCIAVLGFGGLAWVLLSALPA